MITASRGLDNFFAGMEPAQDDYHGFASRMIVCRNIPPRDARFEFISEFGRGVIEELFPPVATKRPTLTETHIEFVFPERHTSVHERQHLFESLKHADTPNLKIVDVITSDPLVVQQAAQGGLWVLHDDRYYFQPAKNIWWREMENARAES